MDIYLDQKGRGSEGFGVWDGDRKVLEKTPKQRKIKSYLNRHPSTEILFHHRYPTSTANVRNACHPFSTKDFFSKENGGSGKTYILIHNGVLMNEDKLKVEHEKLGIKYSSIQQDGRYNDSEALLWDMALYLEGRKDKLDASGSIAFICRIVDPEGEDKLHFGTNRGDLKLEQTDDYFILSSEGQGEQVRGNMLYTLNLKNNTLFEQELTIPRYLTSYVSDKEETEKLGDSPKNDLPRVDDCRWDENKGTMFIKQPDGSEIDWEEFYGENLAKQQKAQEEFDRDYPLSNEEVARRTAVNHFRNADGRHSNPHVDDDTMVKEEVSKEQKELPLFSNNDDDEEDDFVTAQKAKELSDSEIGLLDDEGYTLAFLKLDALKAVKGFKARQKNIRKRYNYYLKFYNGDYNEAYNAVEQDISWLSNEYAAQLNNRTKNDDLMYEIKVMESVLDMLIMNGIDKEDEELGVTPVPPVVIEGEVVEDKTPVTEAVDFVLNQRKKDTALQLMGGVLPPVVADEEDVPLTKDDIEWFKDFKKKLHNKLEAVRVNNLRRQTNE